MRQLAPKLGELAIGGGDTGDSVQDKFSQDTKGMLTYGSLSTFYSGLEGLLGPPNPKVEDGIEREHTSSPDS